MVSERLEVRLDAEHRRKLAELAASRGASVSVLVRQMIDESYEEIMREQRLKIVRELAEMQVEDVPDPETLSKQLQSAHDPGVP
jgi:predicted DNA-binding protein